MKKLVTILMVVAIIMASPFSTFASENGNKLVTASEGTTYTYFEDGSYLLTTLTVESDANFSTSSGTRVLDPFNVTATQTGSYYDSVGDLNWEVTLTAVFYVDPADYAECTSSDLTSVIYKSKWSMSNVDERCVTNNAYGACDMKCRFLGIVTQTVIVEITLTCDKYGNVKVPS